MQVFRLDGSAPTAALFHPTIDGDAPVLNASGLVGPQQSGGSTVYVFALGLEWQGNSTPGGRLFTLSVKEETLVAPLRGLLPSMQLSVTLADCRAPSIVSITALPARARGSFARGFGKRSHQRVGASAIAFSRPDSSGK